MKIKRKPQIPEKKEKALEIISNWESICKLCDAIREVKGTLQDEYDDMVQVEPDEDDHYGGLIDLRNLGFTPHDLNEENVSITGYGDVYFHYEETEEEFQKRYENYLTELGKYNKWLEDNKEELIKEKAKKLEVINKEFEGI